MKTATRRVQPRAWLSMRRVLRAGAPPDPWCASQYNEGERQSETDHGARPRRAASFPRELAHYTAAAGPERAADGELLRARGGASQKQIREIHARDEQNRSHCAPQRDQGMTQFPRHIILQGNWDQASFVSAERVGIFHVEIEIGCHSIRIVESLGDPSRPA